MGPFWNKRVKSGANWCVRSRVPVRMVSVTREQFTTEERCEDQRVSFRREDYRYRGSSHEKSVLSLSRGEGTFVVWKSN